MSYSHREYGGVEDQLRMAELSHRCPAAHLRRTDLPYRFASWALDDAQNGRLWFDTTGALAAWAVMQLPWWTVDFACDPSAADDLLPELLGWADARARAILQFDTERTCWFANVFQDQPEILRLLEQAGYADQGDVGEDSWSKVYMERPGDAPVKAYRVPEGFVVRALGGEGEVGAYVDLQRQVFGTDNMTVEWRARTLRHPDYVPDLDVVIAAPDGRLAAFCIGWLNTHGAEITGQVEPLGCHTDFQRYALGRVALAEVLRRLQAHGARKIQVETDNYRGTAMALYEAMGFRTVRQVRVLRKDVG